MPALPLFWRTFSLLLLLLFVGFSLWSQGIAVRQEYPRAQAMAGQLATAVNLTRSALVYSKPSDRTALLQELNQDERVGVFVREDGDTVVPVEDTRLNVWLTQLMQENLGKSTILASMVNQQAGLWISFDMGGNTLGLNTYWLRVEPKRMETRAQNPTRWWLWLASALLVAFAGAAWITRRLTFPLSALAQRAKALSDGATYTDLPASSVKEIAQVNAGMNHMAKALAAQESEKKLMLAGLSHDLRTPLARLRLEIEMANLSPDQRSGMSTDIAQIDAQLKQFTDFVASDQAHLKPVNLGELLESIVSRYSRDPRATITLNTHETTQSSLTVNADEGLLTRLWNNLIENACRYGRSPDHIAHIVIDCRLTKNTISVILQDHGSGVEPTQIERLIEPFVRGDSARSGAEGSGLGLAIASRIARRHNATMSLDSNLGQGFKISLEFKTL
jgi:two-component system, OmpR family, osmolarity sensor histidine kinase EnvZ